MLDRIQALKQLEWNVPLSRRVAQFLISYDVDGYRRMSVEARGGAVILTGYVADEEARTLAVEIARKTAGVNEVIDRIAVRRQRRAPQPTALDVPVSVALPTRSAWQLPAWKQVPVALIGLLLFFGLGSWWLLRGAGSALPAGFYVVQGTLFIDGRPVDGAELTFYPLAATSADLVARPHAIVGPDGRFTVATPGEGDGAPAGRYVVTARLPARGTAGDTNSAAALPPHYSDPRTSPLSAEIEPADVVSLPPFELARAVGATGKSR